MNKINIRNYFIILITVLYAFISSSETKKTSNSNDKDTARPNIIFIMSYDYAYQAISAYDNHPNEEKRQSKFCPELH